MSLRKSASDLSQRPAGSAEAARTEATESQRPLVSVVSPILNEVENLSQLDSEIRAALRLFGRRSEIIYVDDDSDDDSARLLDSLASSNAEDPLVRTRVLHLSRHFGQTAALAAGFDLAEGEIVIAIDGDLQNNPADIPRLVAKLEEGFDVVSGWRRRRHDSPLTRRLPSQVANWLVARVSQVRLHDFGCTLKAYRRELLSEVLLVGEMHRFIPIYLGRLGGRVAELEVDHRPRTAGRSKYGLGRVFKVALDLVLILFMTRYSTRPMHFFGLTALAFFSLTGLVTFIMFVFKFGWLRFVGIDYSASFVQTPLPAIAGTFVLGGVASLFFGILGEVMLRVQYETSGRRPYRIAASADSWENRSCVE
jgi:glycosyltransferase involved in cell wall biosynthesis